MPKNTSVIIRRVPVTRAVAHLQHVASTGGAAAGAAPQAGGISRPSAAAGAGASGGGRSATTLSKAEELLGVSGSMNVFETNAVDDKEFGGDAMDEAARQNQASAAADAGNEDELIKNMVSQSAMDWRQEVRDANATRRVGFGIGGGGRGRGRGHIGGDVPPPWYVCNRCGKPGHFIAQCPTNGDPAYEPRKLRTPLGLPLSQLYKKQGGTTTDGSGALVTASGEVALLRPNDDVFVKELAALPTAGATVKKDSVPPELQCSLCTKMMTDAMLIPCCQRSFCNDCIRDALKKKKKCPICGKKKMIYDNLLPNRDLRRAIDAYLRNMKDDLGTKAATANVGATAAPKSAAPTAAPAATAASRPAVAAQPVAPAPPAVSRQVPPPPIPQPATSAPPQPVPSMPPPPVAKAKAPAATLPGPPPPVAAANTTGVNGKTTTSTMNDEGLGPVAAGDGEATAATTDTKKKEGTQEVNDGAGQTRAAGMTAIPPPPLPRTLLTSSTTGATIVGMKPGGGGVGMPGPPPPAPAMNAYNGSGMPVPNPMYQHHMNNYGYMYPTAMQHHQYSMYGWANPMMMGAAPGAPPPQHMMPPPPNYQQPPPAPGYDTWRGDDSMGRPRDEYNARERSSPDRGPSSSPRRDDRDDNTREEGERFSGKDSQEKRGSGDGGEEDGAMGDSGKREVSPRDRSRSRSPDRHRGERRREDAHRFDDRGPPERRYGRGDRRDDRDRDGRSRHNERSERDHRHAGDSRRAPGSSRHERDRPRDRDRPRERHRARSRERSRERDGDRDRERNGNGSPDGGKRSASSGARDEPIQKRHRSRDVADTGGGDLRNKLTAKRDAS